MRLLKKSEVSKAKAIDRQREIDEGLKLAKRVDGLRETVTEEEQKLQLFRRKTISKIHEEITEEAHKRDILKKEVADLSDKKRELQKPLDKEWRQVAEENAALDSKREESDTREHTLNDRQANIERQEHLTADSLKRIALTEQDTVRRFEQAAQNATDTQYTLEKARGMEEQAITLIKAGEKELIRREQLVSGRENNATLQESTLTTREIELKNGWKLLRDREALLERNFKRLKK